MGSMSSPWARFLYFGATSYCDSTKRQASRKGRQVTGKVSRGRSGHPSRPLVQRVVQELGTTSRSRANIGRDRKYVAASALSPAGRLSVAGERRRKTVCRGNWAARCLDNIWVCRTGQCGTGRLRHASRTERGASRSRQDGEVKHWRRRRRHQTGLGPLACGSSPVKTVQWTRVPGPQPMSAKSGEPH